MLFFRKTTSTLNKYMCNKYQCNFYITRSHQDLHEYSTMNINKDEKNIKRFTILKNQYNQVLVDIVIFILIIMHISIVPAEPN